MLNDKISLSNNTQEQNREENIPHSELSEPSVSELAVKESVSARLLSLDVFRGGIMLFIMGGSTLFITLAKTFPNDVTQAIAKQMQHVPWHGFAFQDMIFPTFLFLAGVSFPFSLAKQRSRGKTNHEIYRKLIFRTLLLVLVGIIYNNKISFNFAHLRYASVLGHIGLAWFVAAVLYMNTRFRTQALFSIMILIGYWLLLALVPAPDANSAESFSRAAFTERACNLLSPDDQIMKNYSMEGSIVGYVDRTILPGTMYKKIHDPEGILSLIPAIVTAILGTMAGSLLRKENQFILPWKKAAILMASGALLIVIGQVWNIVFPINKNLWTSSFVCHVGGLTMVTLAALYYIIDVLYWRRWSFFFAVIGVNSITIYLAQRVIGFQRADEFFFNGFSVLFASEYRPLILSFGYVVVCWAFLLVLYKKKIFFKM